LRAVLRDRLWQSLFGVLLVLAVTVFYLFSSVLDTPLLHGTRTVRVEMASTGGLFEGSAVTYRGVKVGKVRSINLSPSGVVATVVLTSRDRIPTRTLAKVRSLMDRTGHGEEFPTYLEAVRERHRRKRNLMRLLPELEAARR